MNYKLNAIALLAFSSGISQVSFNNPDEAAIVSYQTKPINISNIVKKRIKFNLKVLFF